MHKARVYFRVVSHREKTPGVQSTPLNTQESRVGFNESSIMRFIHDPGHRCEVIAVPDKTREAVEKVLAEKFPHGNATIDSLTWLT
ncbi:MAG: hypothetical protein ACR2OZ_03005 [Verrucomicrobiales bacterium]